MSTQTVSVIHGIARHSTAQRSTAQHGLTLHSTVQHFQWLGNVCTSCQPGNLGQPCGYAYLSLNNAEPFLNFKLSSQVLIHLIVLGALPSNVKPLLETQLGYDVCQNHVVFCNQAQQLVFLHILEISPPLHGAVHMHEI